MTIFANHPFAKRTLNVLDENGNEGCAVCSRQRAVHPDQMRRATPDHKSEDYHPYDTGNDHPVT